ncbi:hypothetical protein [Flavobacterium sp.]|uniref:hypothetical protein n=1 Tax=Flavobacterium sp. TaxID=239 RepID=UPI00286DAD08|nr:hypothetical protein [Flavobacterium sp.]
MDYKKIILGFLFVIIYALFTACIGEKDDANCKPLGETIQNDLILLSPLQVAYQQGDIINVKLTVPSQNTFFGGVPRNIFAETGATFGVCFLRMYPIDGLFTGNTINLVSGVQVEAPGKYHIPLNFNTGNYEFEANITLNRLGNYKLPSGGNSDQINFIGANQCDFFVIGTSKAGSNANGNIEFVVQ